MKARSAAESSPPTTLNTSRTVPAILYSSVLDGNVQAASPPRAIEVCASAREPALEMDIENSQVVLVGGVHAKRAGSPFRPLARVLAATGTNQMQLPVNVYSAIILIYMSAPSKYMAQLFVLTQGVPAILVTIVAQVSLAAYLYQAVRRGDGDLANDCEATSLWLRWVALTAFVGLCVRELIEVWCMHTWLSMFGKARAHEPLELQKWSRGGMEDASKAAYKVPEAMKESWAKYEVAMHRPTSGITRAARCSFYAIALMPNASVAVFMLLAGTGAILRSANDFDLVINNVAAAFILELDSLVYSLLLPPSVKALCEGVPPLNRSNVEGSTTQQLLRGCAIGCHSCWVFCTVLALNTASYVVWCPWWALGAAAQGTMNGSVINSTSGV